MTHDNTRSIYSSTALASRQREAKDAARAGVVYIPEPMRRAHGDGARKVPVDPFDIVTLYDEQAGAVTVADLVHQRAAWWSKQERM